MKVSNLSHKLRVFEIAKPKNVLFPKYGQIWPNTLVSRNTVDEKNNHPGGRKKNFDQFN